MPVHGLPSTLEASLNTLMAHRPPNSWRVSSHDGDVTVVIKWPRHCLSSGQNMQIVPCRSPNDESSEESQISSQISKSKRHIWSKHGKHQNSSKQEIVPYVEGRVDYGKRQHVSKQDVVPYTEGQVDYGKRQHGGKQDVVPYTDGRVDTCPASKLENNSLRVIKNRHEPYPSPSRSATPSSPFPVYTTTSGQGTKTFSYSYSAEKVKTPPRHDLVHQHSDEIRSKRHPRLKDIGKSKSSPGIRTHMSPPSASSSSSTSSARPTSSTSSSRQSSTASASSSSSSSSSLSSMPPSSSSTSSLSSSSSSKPTSSTSLSRPSSSSSLLSPPSSCSSLPVDAQTSKSSRRRIKSESSMATKAKTFSVTQNESSTSSSENADLFYQSIAKALKGYGPDPNASPADPHFLLGSPARMGSSGEDGAATINSQSENNISVFVSRVDKARKYKTSHRSMHHSLWDSLDGDEMEGNL